MASLIKVTTVGDANSIKRGLRVAAAGIKRTRIPNRQISVWLLRWVNENFKSQGGKVGGWKPFKLGGRRLPGGQIDRSAKLLQDTGRLRASFSPFHSRRFAGVRSRLPYSITHDLGLPHRNLPARRMIPIGSDQDVRRAVIRIYSAHIRKVTRK